ncbi:uncharacterized protein SCHCODRAFT_02489833 [Schizophyllum commune H4-8]|uniref:Expressed protein n=1 Tax=Schizophyllum commune (strain H4-8 / FGSC 9210) TaxID=578458 RepID=D8PRU2_SCHCM|nr:uncharacterized protein SCHCODRAFT_02489833 [Schizophyllum commune H4-8]KAI5897922.1 hypothetical protein SCHCODRAFT_02489833 [Schizophyllum commune H4-8]
MAPGLRTAKTTKRSLAVVSNSTCERYLPLPQLMLYFSIICCLDEIPPVDHDTVDELLASGPKDGDGTKKVTLDAQRQRYTSTRKFTQVRAGR